MKKIIILITLMTMVFAQNFEPIVVKQPVILKRMLVELEYLNDYAVNRYGEIIPDSFIVQIVINYKAFVYDIDDNLIITTDTRGDLKPKIIGSDIIMLEEFISRMGDSAKGLIPAKEIVPK